jgi:hypothetical protein
VETKRRLPVIGSSGDGVDDAPSRAPWQWVAFGALAIFVTWLPLAFLATWGAARLHGSGASPAASVVILAVGLALAALAGGFLVGRWGSADVGVREAALSGLATAAVASALAFGAPGAAWGTVMTVLLAVPFAALGGRIGLRRRRRGAVVTLNHPG